MLNYSTRGEIEASISRAVAVQTNPMAAGTYLVTGMEGLQISAGDTAYCDFGIANIGPYGRVEGVSGPFSQTTYSTITITESVPVTAGESIVLYCSDLTNDPNTYTDNGSITAIQLNRVS